MALPLLVSCEAGSPDDPRTWSGTAAKLMQALKQTGLVEPKPWSVRETRLNASSGSRHPFVQGPVRRLVAGAASARAAWHHECKAMLHLGTSNTPLIGSGPPGFLYADTTFNLWERQALAARSLSRWQRHWLRRVERMELRRMRHIFTVGRHVAADLIQEFGLPANKVTAVGTGPGGLASFDGPKDYHGGRLLTVAKLRHRDKGLPLLLEAFALARRRRPDLTLTVIGGASYKEAAAPEGARFLGWIPMEELQALFNDATLFVLPASYEPWGLSYLEALACRTPLVGMPRNAYPEISQGGQFGFVLPEPHPERLADLLLDALAAPERLATMGARGQEYCRATYQWDKVARVMAQTIVREIGTGQ